MSNTNQSKEEGSFSGGAQDDRIKRVFEEAGAFNAWNTLAGECILEAARDLIAESARAPADCEWSEDDPYGAMPGTWSSGCGELWSFIDGGPKENAVRFCHGCGKPVRVVPFPVEDEDEPALSSQSEAR